MAKRFGRNQKRAMREQIAQLSTDLTTARRLYLRTQQERDDAHQAIRTAREYLGQHHAALPPLKVSMETTTPKCWQFLPTPPLRASIEANISSMQACTAEMLRLAVEMKELPQNEIHFIAQLGETGRAGYCISRAALEKMPKRQRIDQLRHCISNDIAHMIAGA